MDVLDVQHGLDVIDEILKHATATSLLAAFLIGIGGMFLCRFWIHEFIVSDRRANWTTWAACVFWAMFGAALTCPLQGWRAVIAWIFAIGLSVPSVWWVLTGLLGWKWPTLAAALKLKRITPELENENDVQPPEPRPDAH